MPAQSGATNALGDLTTDAAGRVDLGGSSIVTLEDQTYGDQVQLGTDTTLTGRHITFAQTAEGDGNGPWDLTVNGSGITTFAGSVGATNALGDPTTELPDVQRSVDMEPVADEVAVRTIQNQRYVDPVLLINGVRMTSASGNVLFEDFVDSAEDDQELSTGTNGAPTAGEHGLGSVHLDLQKRGWGRQSGRAFGCEWIGRPKSSRRTVRSS